MWQVAEFHSTTLFSLRPLNATTSGGKTLLTPTPFALKMALLDAAIRLYGVEFGQTWFPSLRDLQIAVRLPVHIVVINTFIKILRPHKSGPKDLFGTGLEGPMGNTIAYRELVHFGGPLRIAFMDPGKTNDGPPLHKLLAQINYLGKRGGFMQFAGIEQLGEINQGYTRLDRSVEQSFQINGLLQLLDDWGPKMTFAHADVFSGKSLSVGREDGRLARPIILPYKLVRSSHSFTLYERTDLESSSPRLS